MKDDFFAVVFFLGFLTGIILVFKYKRHDLLKKFGLAVSKTIYLFMGLLGILVMLLILAVVLYFIFHGTTHYSIESEPHSETIEEVTGKDQEELRGEIQELRENIKDLETMYEIKEIEEEYKTKRIDEMEKEIQELEFELSGYKEIEEEEEEERKKIRYWNMFFEFIKTIFTYILGLFTLYLSEEIKDKIKSFKERRNGDDEEDGSGE